MEFADRMLTCSDCATEFVFTAGEQLFFYDKQFKNDPKRCKLCKARRSGAVRAAGPDALAALPLSRTETRTECSACGIPTTVPFKPTQGRPVLCRGCFQMKRVPSGVAAAIAMDSPAAQVQAAVEAIADELDGGQVLVSASQATMDLIAESPHAALVEPEAAGEAPLEAPTALV